MNKAISDRPIERLLEPIQEFFHKEASSGILLLIATVIALIWANSPLAASYSALWQTRFTIGVGDAGLSKPLLLWINDGLMAIFFFLVGLEIKREILVGELSSVKRSALPIAAALGGIILPATIYLMLNAGTEGASGWGIPMATDIAFAIGLLALLGDRVPLGLKIFLTALAIIDDIAAVLVIAIFYTADISLSSIYGAAGVMVLLFVVNRFGVRTLTVYILLGLVLWFLVLKSGVHATVAGVLLAMAIPARSKINLSQFEARSRALLEEFKNEIKDARSSFPSEHQKGILQALETNCQEVEAPLQRLEHALHPWVAFFIMPIFVLANAGVSFEGGLTAVFTHPVSLGIFLGLVVGKQVGILLFSWFAVRLKMAELPHGVNWSYVYGVGWLGGVGFTMSLFISALAFGGTALHPVSKVGILVASFAAAVGGLAILHFRARSE